MNVQEVTLELSKGTVPGQIVRLGQGDSGGTTIRAVVYDGGTEADLTGAQASFLIRLPDGTHYVRDANCTVSGNVITYVVDEAHCCLASGYTDEVYFEFTKDGRTYSTSRFRVKIERAANDGAEIPPGSWDTAVDAAIDAANDAAELANAAATAAGIDSRISTAAHQAADEAASEVEDRVETAIDAMGDISELAVPLMTSDTRGGAKLEQHGGLALRDGALGIGSLVQESDGYARGGLAEVTAKGHAEQVSTTGKNLLPFTPSTRTSNGVTFTVNEDGSVNVNGTAMATADYGMVSALAGLYPAGTYTFSGGADGGGPDIFKMQLSVNSHSDDNGSLFNSTDVKTLTLGEGDNFVFRIRVYSGVTVNNLTFYPQLELGSTATEYEPYTGGLPSPRPDWEQPIEVVRGHEVTGKTGRFVDLVVKQGNTTLSTTPIPLPQRGWVAGLPDGTADSLRLDGAGGVEWTLPCGMEINSGIFDKYEIKTNSLQVRQRPVATKASIYIMSDKAVGGDVDAPTFAVSTMMGANNSIYWRIPDTMAPDGVTDLATFNAWAASNPVTILYPLATPVTEECGYVEDWPTNITEDAVISIPELDAVNIKYFIDSTVTVLAKQWYARANSEYADRLEALEEAVADLVTGA